MTKTITQMLRVESYKWPSLVVVGYLIRSTKIVQECGPTFVQFRSRTFPEVIFYLFWILFTGGWSDDSWGVCGIEMRLISHPQRVNHSPFESWSSNPKSLLSTSSPYPASYTACRYEWMPFVVNLCIVFSGLPSLRLTSFPLAAFIIICLSNLPFARGKKPDWLHYPRGER